MRKVWIALILLCMILAVSCESTQNFSLLPSQAIETPTVTSTAVSIPSATPTKSCGNGTLTEESIDSKEMGKSLTYLIYIPGCTAEANDYPLLILLHGQQYDEFAWKNFGIVELADNWIASGQVQPFIMVFPYEQNFVMEPYEEHFGDAIVNDLLPHLEQNYPVCRQADCRAIGGFSRGAAWAVWTGLNYQGIFGAIGAHSFTPFAGDYARTPTWLREFGEIPYPQIYIDSGEDDPFLPGARQYVEVLEQFNVPLEFIIRQGDHSSDYWIIHLEDYLNWYVLEILRP